MSTETPTRVTLQSSDSQQFTVDSKVVQLSGLLKDLLEDLPEATAEVIPIPEVSGAVLEKVLEWCERYSGDKPEADFYTADNEEFAAEWANLREGPMKKKWALMMMTPHEDQCKVIDTGATPCRREESLDLPMWDSIFLEVSLDDLVDLLNAANYLDIEELVARCCKAVADRISDKTTEEMREIFGVVSDFEPGEEERIREQNAWAAE